MIFNQVAAVAASDKLVVLTSDSQSYQTETLAQVAAYVLALIGGAGGLVTQYASPSATGFTVNLGSVSSTWLILTPTGTFATGTLVLPPTPSNQNELNISCTQIVTALTINGNGKTVTGAPTTLAANGFFRLRYDSVNQTWYRVF